MASGIAFDLLLGVGNDHENEVFELSYAAFAEELQLQEILKESMVASENAACEATKKPGCPVCYRLSCMECSTPHQGSGFPEPQVIDLAERAAPCSHQRFRCIEQQRINENDNERERFPWRRPTERFRGRRMGDVPQAQTSSSNEFQAKTSSLGENDLIAGIGNTEDPKSKGIAMDDGWLLEDNNTNAVQEDDYDSLNDEDEFDSDYSQKSHESGKKSTWFKEFFERMDALNIEEIDETLWHCPACIGGPGATKWYRSISDLIAHSKKIGSRRVKLHRELAKILETELCIKGTSILHAGPISGTWKGLTDDAFAEELQLEEILKESMVAFENAACEATKKPGCSFCNRLSCMECCTPHQGSGFPEPQVINLAERAVHRSHQRFRCIEQQRINENDNGSERFQWRRPTARFWGRRMGDVPQAQNSSSNEFHAKTSSLGESDLIAGTVNTEDPKDKGIAIDDGWLLVSKWKSDSRVGNRADKLWVDAHHPNPLKGSKDNNTNAVQEDDYDSLNDEDEFDSDYNQKSHESGKKSTWFKEFFERKDALNIEEIDETPWHCPACKGGPGATKWYRSISDLIAHSKNIGSRRVKLHRELAKLLETELCIKGTSIPPAGPISGTWKGLTDDARDHELVWPPMVVISNTLTSNIQDGKFIGMGNQELLEHFSSYPALKAQHSYGPKGHRGLSVLIFEKSAVGYLEAERLHKNFLEQRLGRSAWNSCTNEVLPSGERQLYGYMALKEDLDVFNQHFQGKSKIKFELKSYQEAVLNEIKEMKENSQHVILLKDRLEEETKRAEVFERSVNNLSRNLQQKMEDIRIFEKRVKSMHEENEEEIESQESFYKDQIKILEARVKELEGKLQVLGANTLLTGEPDTANLREECSNTNSTATLVSTRIQI
ncbi:SGS3 [Hibiscus syriacus]|uniref:SGS3 n=1 Tax=Hibiscus syriacus TaxID=106335 RepID=A0A6A3A9D8_HIBSY|nr:uncharacterized protein LOC120131676 [Hibiscus syriacus]KAE8700738.1 SGS3 [Hibiscus syriacus]